MKINLNTQNNTKKPNFGKIVKLDTRNMGLKELSVIKKSFSKINEISEGFDINISLRQNSPEMMPSLHCFDLFCKFSDDKIKIKSKQETANYFDFHDEDYMHKTLIQRVQETVDSLRKIKDELASGEMMKKKMEELEQISNLKKEIKEMMKNEYLEDNDIFTLKK